MRRSERFILSIDPVRLVPVINRHAISYLRERGSVGWCAKCSRVVFEWISYTVRMILKNGECRHRQPVPTQIRARGFELC